MCASSDGSYVVCIEDNNTLSIRQCNGLKQIVRLTCECQDIASTGRWLVAISSTEIRLVDMKLMRVKHRVKLPFSVCRVGLVHPNTVVCCSESGNVAWCDVDEDDGRITSWRVASGSNENSDEFKITGLSTSCSHVAVTFHSKSQGTKVVLWRLDTHGRMHLESSIEVERILSRLDDSKSSAIRRRSEASVVCLAPNSRDPKLLIASSGSDANTIRLVVYSVSGDCVMASEEFRDSQSSSESILPPFVPVTSAVLRGGGKRSMAEENYLNDDEIENLNKSKIPSSAGGSSRSCLEISGISQNSMRECLRESCHRHEISARSNGRHKSLSIN